MKSQFQYKSNYVAWESDYNFSILVATLKIHTRESRPATYCVNQFMKVSF